MFDKPQIVVTVSPHGTVNIETFGFKGDACAVATKRLEEVLVSRDGSISETKKDEYYEQEDAAGTLVDSLRL